MQVFAPSGKPYGPNSRKQLKSEDDIIIKCAEKRSIHSSLHCWMDLISKIYLVTCTVVLLQYQEHD